MANRKQDTITVLENATKPERDNLNVYYNSGARVFAVEEISRNLGEPQAGVSTRIPAPRTPKRLKARRTMARAGLEGRRIREIGDPRLQSRRLIV